MPLSCAQFVSEDIEVIETTIPKLQAYKICYAVIVSDVDALMHSASQYSVSAISSEAVKSKNSGLLVIIISWQ